MKALQISTISLVLLSFGIFSVSFGRFLRILAQGKARNRLDRIPSRIAIFVREVFLHHKLLRDPVPGVLHFFIFWGFVVLTLGTMEWIYFGVTNGGHFDFLGAAYP